LAQYIFARFHIRVGRYEHALPVISYLLQKNELLPDLIERETQMMFASTNMALGHYDIALITFEYLLSHSKNDAETLFVRDQIERIQFKRQHHEK
jgi:regulator of sirC expression with transglutaminase-like and TPR domain